MSIKWLDRDPTGNPVPFELAEGVKIMPEDGFILPRWDKTLLRTNSLERIRDDLPEQEALGLHWVSHDRNWGSFGYGMAGDPEARKDQPQFGVRRSLGEIATMQVYALGFHSRDPSFGWLAPDPQELLHVHEAFGEQYRRFFDRYWVWSNVGDDKNSPRFRGDPSAYSHIGVDLCSGEMRWFFAFELLFYRAVRPLGWWTKTTHHIGMDGAVSGDYADQKVW